MPQTNAKFSILVACMSIGLFGRTGWLHAAAFQTNATCSPSSDWSWMNNQNGSSPCLTAAAVSQPCFTAGRNSLNLRTFIYSISFKNLMSYPLALMKSTQRQEGLTVTNATGIFHISHYFQFISPLIQFLGSLQPTRSLYCLSRSER